MNRAPVRTAGGTKPVGTGEFGMEQIGACLWMTAARKERGGGLQARRSLATDEGGERHGKDRDLTVARRPQVKLDKGGTPNRMNILYSSRGTEDELACCSRRAWLMRRPAGDVLQGTETLLWTQQEG